MPAPARISVPVKQPTPSKHVVESTPKTPSSMPRPKARVVHRRRARGRVDDTDTDDDLVREPRSDSDTESATSTLDSESMSDSESQEDPRVPSPSRSALVATGSTSSPLRHFSRDISVFPQPHDWSDMVADENANGVAELPVIDFAELSSHTQAASPPSHTALPSPPSAPEQPEASQSAVAPGSPSTAPRKPGQSARQAYLTRLDNDPAYVPTLGRFWSHDDRLLDKDLRSLSGWWRGRWQGRGRGVHGRGGFTGGRGRRGQGSFGNSNDSYHPNGIPEEAPLADRAWTHDGFEEMKKADEAKRQQYPFRGRGGFPRGRGGFRRSFSPRGGFASANRSSSPHGAHARHQSESQHSSTSDTLKFGDGTRPWFTMKPERVWTKQFDGYLYFETQLKPMHNQGLGQGVRIKLPRKKGGNEKPDGLDNEAVVVRLPQRSTVAPTRSTPATLKGSLTGGTIVVKLPPGKRSVSEDESLAPEDVTTGAPPPMEDSLPPVHSVATPTYRTHLTRETSLLSSTRPLVPPPARVYDEAVVGSRATTNAVATPDQPAEAPPLPRKTPEESSVAFGVTSAGPSHPRLDLPVCEGSEIIPPTQPQPPVLPTLQAVVPPFQSSPPYGSPYTYPTPGLPLPPGIAVTETGVTYEIATGRAVYLHTPPPPPPPPMQVPMYNPRPMPMHHAHHGSVHFLPHHRHASSISMSVSPPGFLSSPPIFSLPRQSSRIEIKAPGEEKGKGREAAPEQSSSQARSTGSRLAVNVNAEPFTPSFQPQGYYAPDVQQQQAFDEAQRHHQHPSMYQPTSYYYPIGADGNAPYGYGQQYGNVDVGQSQQYDAYPQEPYPQQPAVYY